MHLLSWLSGALYMDILVVCFFVFFLFFVFFPLLLCIFIGEAPKPPRAHHCRICDRWEWSGGRHSLSLYSVETSLFMYQLNVARELSIVATQKKNFIFIYFYFFYF